MATLKDLPHSDWQQMQEYWLGHIPAKLIPPTATVERLLQLASVELVDKSDIDIVSGVRERAFGDALFLRDKARYCLRISYGMIDSGFSTWTALSMYDASFFAAKSLIYLLGIKDASRSSSAYISLFQRDYKKGNMVFDGHKAFFLKKRMTHEILWSLLERIIGTIKGQGAGVSDIKALRKNDYSTFSRERNWLTYESISWSREDDIEGSDLAFDCSYIPNKMFVLSNGSERAEFVDKYYLTSHYLLNIIDKFLGDLAVYAPAIDSYLTERPGPAVVTRVTF